MVAAGLDGDEAAHALAEAGGELSGRSKSLSRTSSTSGMARNALGLELDRAAGGDDAGLGAVAARAADRLAGLAHRFGGDRAAVDDDPVVVAGARP